MENELTFSGGSCESGMRLFGCMAFWPHWPLKSESQRAGSFIFEDSVTCLDNLDPAGNFCLGVQGASQCSWERVKSCYLTLGAW